MIPAIQEIGFGPGTEKAYATLHQATVSFAEMGERTISTQVRIDGDVVPDFDGWEVSFKGERFILNTKDPQAVKDNSTRNSLVDLTFVSWVVNELKRYFFFEPTSIDASTAIADKYKASVNVPVEDFAVLFNKVLDYYFDGKVVFSLYMSGQGQYSTDRALVEIDYTYIWDVLVKFFEIYGVRWRIEHDNTNDVYTIKAGWPTTDIDINDHDFEYGYKGGLLRFERQVQDVDIHNILLGRGGEKNIPYRYFKRIDPQNPDWAADPDAIPELSNIYFDRLRDINFRWYVRGWMQNPNHDTSWEEDGYVYPTYTIASDSPYYFAYQKGLTEKFNPVEYVKDDESIADYGEHWGALDDNDDIFPTIQGVTRDPLGRIDETVAVSEIVTDDIEAMAQNAAIEKSINRLTISLDGDTRTEFDLQSEEFTIPSGSTGNVTYVPVGTDEVNPGLVRFDTENSTVVAVADGTEYPIDALPAGTYRLKLHMVIARSGQATSATGTFGIENIVLTTSSMDTDAWKPTFDIWVKNIWGTTKGQDENDIQYAERVWLPILGDRAGNEAKIVFSTGFMSVSEDYEFTIVSYPVYDTSKSINGVPSEWRITLRKSDAEFDATGLYIPNASTGGQPVAGDKFFFIGIDMPFRYVELAEEDLNTNKEAQLDTEATISPTWIMNLDKVRVHTLEDQEYGQTLADRLAAGGKVWIKDRRFTPGQRLQLYVQSITYTWNEPSDDSPYIVPDIEVVLSDKVVAVDSVVQRIQNDVSSIKNQYARISDVEAVVRSVAEPIFLKKTGESDSSDSPTQFSSKVTSKGFRQGAIGGTGWGIYRDNTSVWAEAEAESATRTRGLLRAVAEERNTEGDTVFEADRIVVRKELQVNSLVINQISYLGGKEIISAAKIEVSKVIETEDGYVCYFDQRRNSVANNFVVNDIAMGQVFDPYNAELRYYKALVTAVDIDSITISKTQKVGSGVPLVGDVIVQYGNTTQSGRQYVIVRDVVGGGYERMLSGLDSLSSDGDEYYFAGRESSGTGPRWFVGSHEQNGDYAEYENGVLTIKANVVFKQGQVIPGLSDLTDDVEALEYLKTALPKSDTIITGGLILSKVIALRDANNNIMSGINGDTSLSNIAAWYGGPMADKEASPTPASYAKSLFRFDGSGYLAGGNIHWNNQGYGGIPGITWSNDGTSDVVTIGANVRLASVDGDTVTDLLRAVNELMDLFEVVNGNIHVKNNRGFYSDSFISAGGLSDGGGSAGGNATLVAQSYGGTLSATGINPINFYSKEKVDQLIATAGTVQTVAGVSPVSGDIPVASLKSALSLGAAAAYGVGSVASGNTGLVTGGDVWTAIDNLPEPMVFKGSLGTGGTITSLPAASSANEGFTYKVITAGTYRGTAAKVGDTFISNGSAWILIPSGDEPEGTVTSVGLSMPTGFSVSSSPITSSGTLTVSFASGYSLPTTTKQSNWDTAYGWGNHANAGYLLATTAADTYATISALNGVSGRVTTLENRTNWDTYFGIDNDGNVYVKKNGTNPRGFYSYGFVSAGGASSGGGSAGVDLSAVWQSLKTNTDDYANQKINAYHIPIGTGLKIQNGLIVATNSGTVTGVSLAAGATNGTLHLVVNGTAQSDVAVTGLGSMAYKSSLAASDIPNLSWNKITSDKPTTLSGYGITDALRFQAFPDTYVAARFTDASLAGLAATKYIEFWQTDAGFFNFKVGKLDAIGAITSTSSITGTSFVKSGGTSSQFLKADGSVDSSTYLTGINSTMVTTALGYTPANVTALGNYVLKSGDTMTGTLTLNHTYQNQAGIRFLNTRTQEGRAWAISIIRFCLADGTVASNLGWYGDQTDLKYIYLGNQVYDGANFRVYADKVAFGTNTIFHQGNANISTANWTANQMTAQSFKLASGTPTLTWDANANAWHLSGNLYADGFISAGGVSSGGGTSGVDLTAVWNNLIANTGEGLNKKIHTEHLPTVTITGTNISGTGTYSGTGGSASTLTLNLTAVDTTYSAGTGISLSGTTISLASGVCTAGTYRSVYVDTYGRVTSGTNPTSLSGYGILDAMNFYAGGSGTQTYLAARFQNADYATLAYEHYIEFWQTNAGWFNFHIGSLVSEGSITSTGAIRGSSIAVTNGAANQFLKADGSLDSSTYLTGNQTITLSGDVSGSGETSISVSIGEGKVTNAMLAGSIENSKLNTIGVSKGGTGLTTWTGAYRLVYSTAATTLTTLAPNSTTTRKFLRQVGANNAATAPAWDTVTKTDVGLSNVENTALSTWAGTTNITTLGTITSGTWNGSAIAWSKLSISAQNLYDTIGSTTYAAYHAAGYVKKDGDTMTGALTPASTQVGVSWAAQYYTYSSLNTPDTQVAGFSFYHGEGTNYASGYPYGYADIISFGESRNALQFAWTRGVAGYSNLSVRSYENSVWGDWKKIWNSGNAGAGYAWKCTTLTASGKITGTGGATINGGILMDGSTSGMFVGGASSGLGSSFTGGLVYAYRNNPLYFYTNSNSRMIITGAGNVGIGTTTPAYKLDVAGDVRLYTNLRILRTSITPNEYLNISMADSNAYYNGYDAADGWVNHAFQSNGTNIMVVYGNPNASYKVDIYGNARVQGNFVATGAITAGSASDARLKTNIQSLSVEAAKRIVMALNPVTFTWNEKATELYNQYKGDDLGMIAQEVEPYLPQAVGTIFENYKRLDYTKVISPLVKVAQDHETRIERLEKEVMARDAKIMELESEVKRLRMN